MGIRLHNGVGRMSTNSPIFLKPGKVYDLGGKQYTLEQLREHAIDSMMYQKHLKELMEKQ